MTHCCQIKSPRQGELEHKTQKVLSCYLNRFSVYARTGPHSYAHPMNTMNSKKCKVLPSYVVLTWKIWDGQKRMIHVILQNTNLTKNIANICRRLVQLGTKLLPSPSCFILFQRDQNITYGGTLRNLPISDIGTTQDKTTNK